MADKNSLVYKCSKEYGKERIQVTIRLNDECKNGHQDFAITADIDEKGNNGRWYEQSGGCLHDDILKHFPQFKMFVDLHLCDYLGIPMHCTANGYYHLTNGFNDTKPDNKEFKQEFCDYYRISSMQYDIISQSKSEIQYYLHLLELCVFDQWKAQADEAIKELEKLTGDTFVVDSVRTQLHAPTDEAIAAERQRIADGYYTPEAEAQRTKGKVTAKIAEMTAEVEEKHQNELVELGIKTQVLLIGGFEALDDCIFYDHTKTLAFNWRGYSKGISEDLFNKISAQIKLPEGVTMKLKG